jgi:hypothetical protein
LLAVFFIANGIYLTNEIIHNPRVNDRLRALGVRFLSDPGESVAAVTADDVVATIKAFSSQDFRGRPVTDFTNFVRATALDPQTVQLAFSDGYCPALASARLQRHAVCLLHGLPRRAGGAEACPRAT